MLTVEVIWRDPTQSPHAHDSGISRAASGRAASGRAASGRVGPDHAAAAFVHQVHRIPAGLTIRQLLERIGEEARRAAIEAGQLGLARYGRRAWLDDVLLDGDRVEIVEPIEADARAARFTRVAEERARRSAGSAVRRRRPDAA